MQRIIFSFLLSFILHLNGFSQVNSKDYHFQLNNTKIPDSIKKINQRSILFFCPIRELDSTVFKIKSNELLKSDIILNIGEINFYFFYFKENLKNNSKGIILRGIDTSQKSIPIGQFECFFVNFNKQNVYRAKEKSEIQYELKEPFSNENILRVSIVDTNVCFKNIQGRIPFYDKFINESIKPNYSIDEKFNQMFDTIYQLREQLQILEKRTKLNEDRLKQLDSNKEPIKKNEFKEKSFFLKNSISNKEINK